VSLRFRLLAGMAVVMVALVVAGVLIKVGTERHLTDQVDDRLRRLDIPLGDLIAAMGPLSPSGSADEVAAVPSPTYIGVVDPATDQLTTIAVPHEGGVPVPPPAVPPALLSPGPSGTDEVVTVRSADGATRYRAVVVSTAEMDVPLPAELSDVVVVVAVPLDQVDDAVDGLVRTEAIALASVLAVLGLVTWWVLHLGVRPIKRMADAAAVVAGGDLSHRIPAGTAGTEAKELQVALNQMLGTIDAALDERRQAEERLRQFLADASHELRTPVATVRGYAELYRAGGLADPGRLDDALRRTEQEAERMGRLIDDMLTLAHLDEGRPLERSAVDLAAVAADAAQDVRALDPERPVTTEIDPVEVMGDDGGLRQIAGNLVRNAVVHTPPGTAVEVSVRRDGGDALLSVRDDGPGMDEATASKVFERFFRADTARARATGGSGLGLAIVRSIAEAHGGTVALRTSPGGGTTVTVELPAR
jgi:two-component system OmpR family sensor kinase